MKTLTMTRPIGGARRVKALTKSVQVSGSVTVTFYDPELVREVTATGQLALLQMLERVREAGYTVGTHCAGCGKYRAHRRGKWLCLACLSTPSADPAKERLRQSYLTD